MPKSLAILLPCLLTGGTEVATLETARAFCALGYAVDVLVYFDEIDPAMLRTFEGAGIRAHRLGVRRDGGWPALFKLTAGLLKTLAGGRYALVWVQYMTPTLLPLLVARLFTRQLIAAVHVAAGHYSLDGLRRMRGLARWWCTRFVCVSETTATGIFGQAVDGQRMGGRVVVVPNAINVAEVQQVMAWDWRHKLNWPADCIITGFAGRLVTVKGGDILLQALVRLENVFPRLRVVVVGDGAEREKLQAFVDRQGLSERVHFAGRLAREDVLGAIKGFDIAAMPSRPGLEGFGLSALEAMAAGVPVVASRVDALEEVIVDGETGLLCEVESPVSLAAGLMRLLGDNNLRRQMGAAGVIRAKLYFDQIAFRGRIADLLSLDTE